MTSLTKLHLEGKLSLLQAIVGIKSLRALDIPHLDSENQSGQFLSKVQTMTNMTSLTIGGKDKFLRHQRRAQH